MKRALVITPKNIYDVNGTSNYAYKLIIILINNGYQVDYYYYFNSKHLLEDRKIESDKLINLNKALNAVDHKEFLNEYEKDLDAKINILKNIEYIHAMTKLLNKKVNFSQYNLILDCTNYQNINFMQQENYFFIQQFQYEWYMQKKYIENGFFNPFNYAKNLVLYDSYQLKDYNKNQNYFFNPLCSYNEKFILEKYSEISKNINEKFNGDIVYIGRINNIQKNICFINEMNTKYGLNIKVYGPIEHNTKVTNYGGKLSRTELIKILEKAKFSILVSNTEGFSYSMVESISLGVPVIIRDSYPSAKYLTSKNNGFLLSKDLNSHEFAKRIKEIQDDLTIDGYKNLVKNCIDFAISDLSTDDFEKRWLQIINTR